MTHQAAEPLIEVGIYDPSSRLGGSYWQWGNTSRDTLWETTAGVIHKGWPMRGEVDTRTSVLYGAIRRDGEESFWFYRVYPAGRDQFNRPGRYFIVLFRLRCLEDILSRQVSGVLEYFDTMRERPLKTTPLEKGLPESSADGRLVKFVTALREKSQTGHWGFDHTAEVFEFDAAQLGQESSPLPPVENSAQQKNPIKQTGRRCIQEFIQNLCCKLKVPVTACLVGILIGLVIGFQSGRRMSDPPRHPPPAVSGSNKPDPVPKTCPTCRRVLSDDRTPDTQANPNNSRSSDTSGSTNPPTGGKTP